MRSSISGPAFQVFGIGLLLLQSLLAPLLLGLEDFGTQIMLLLPVFLAQAVVEPAFQAHFNGDGRGRSGAVDITTVSLMVGVAAIVFLLTVNVLDQRVRPLISVALAAFVLNTLFQARAFAMEAFGLAAICAFLLLAGYGIGLGIGMYLAPSSALIFANALGFGLSSLAYWVSALCDGQLRLYAQRASFAKSISGLTYRLPALTVSTLFLVVLSSIRSAPTEIAAFRIFISALNAGRYANVVSLPRLQVALQNRFFTVPGGNGPNERVIRTYGYCLIVYLIALAALFPSVFAHLFGQAPFGPFATLFSGLLVLLQPLAYAVVAFRTSHQRVSAVLFVGLAAISLTAFSGLVWAGVSPFAALPSVITMMVLSLSCILWFFSKVVQ